MIPASPLRRFVLESVMWLFGMSLTIFLVGTWGRAIAQDQATVERAATEVAEASFISERVVEWIVDSLDTELSALPTDAEPVVRAALESPAVRQTVAGVVTEMVSAAYAPQGSTVTVDIRSDVEASLPEIIGLLESQGIEVESDELAGVVAALEPVELETGADGPVGGGLSATRGVLKAAMLLSAGSAILFAALALVLGADRRLMVKRLGVRAGLTGLGFAMMAYLGAWALDPSRGGADAVPSLRTAGALLLRSNLHVPLILSALGGITWLVFRKARPLLTQGPPSDDVPPNPELTSDVEARAELARAGADPWA